MDPGYARSQRALDAIEQRLAALQDMHVDTSSIQGHTATVRALILAQQYDEAEGLCADLQEAAASLTRSSPDTQSSTKGLRPSIFITKKLNLVPYGPRAVAHQMPLKRL